MASNGGDYYQKQYIESIANNVQKLREEFKVFVAGHSQHHREIEEQLAEGQRIIRMAYTADDEHRHVLDGLVAAEIASRAVKRAREREIEDKQRWYNTFWGRMGILLGAVYGGITAAFEIFQVLHAK